MGSTYELAASYAGISYQTFLDWQKSKSEFLDTVKLAEGKAAVKWLSVIEQAANDGTWQAAAWKLERRYPNQYGKTVVNNQITGADGKELTVVFSQREDGPQ